MTAWVGATEGTKGERTRAAIERAAAQAFRRDGYDGATLADIADELGITRSAVLHHFASKAELLREIVVPFFAELDGLLGRAAAAGSFTPRSRRAFVVEVVEMLARFRDVAAVLTRDVSSSAHLDDDLQIAPRAARFIEITRQANDDHPLAAVRSLAALGSFVRPLAAPNELVDYDDPATRETLVACAMAVFKVPLPVSPESGPSPGRGDS